MKEEKSGPVRSIVTMVLLLQLLSIFEISCEGSKMDDILANEQEPSWAAMDGGYFTENKGQWDERVRFMSKGQYGTTYFLEEGIYHDLIGRYGGHVIKVAFDAPFPSEPTGISDLGSDMSYFLGSDPDHWVTGARSFEEVLYEDVWPGTDIRYRYVDGQLKYDVILGASADPCSVRFRVEGSSGMAVKDDCLEIMTGSGPLLLESMPIAFYEDGESVPVRFDVIDQGTYGFEVEKEPGRVLTIDPLLFSTVIGGTNGETPTDFEMDEDGEIYLYGYTMSKDFPNTTGAYDNTANGSYYSYVNLFVSKMDRNASRLIFSTYIGGWSIEYSDEMDIDENEAIYLTGYTYGHDFPTTPGAFQRDMNGGSTLIFVIKLAANGSALLYSTLVGGNTINVGCGIVARNGNACVCGHALGYDFPTHEGPKGGVHGYAVYFELNWNGSEMVDYASIDGYYGDWLTDLALDSNGDVIMAGYTASPQIPFTPHSVQFKGSPLFNINAIIVKYKPGIGAFEFISEFGADMCTYIKGIAVDDDDNIYFTGNTKTSGTQPYPTTTNAIDSNRNHSINMFITKLDPNGTSLQFSAILGGAASESGEGLDIDENGNIYVAGYAMDLFPVPGLDGGMTSHGKEDALVLKLDPDCSRVLNLTFVGGSGTDKAIWCRLRDEGEILIGGEKGSPDFPITGKFNLSDTNGVFVASLTLWSIPSEPVGPKACANDGHMDLEWTPPVDDGNCPIINYTVYRGRDPLDLSILAVLNVTTNFTDTSTPYGIPHFYSISATNYCGEGAMSSVVSNISSTQPQPPRDLHVIPRIGSIDISYGPPLFDGGSPILGYSLYKDGEPISNFSSKVLSFKDTEIGLGIHYEYSVTSWNKNGESSPCTPVTVRSKTYSSPPVNLTCRPRSGSMELRWEEPLDNGGLDIESYTVFRGTEPLLKTDICTVPFHNVSYRDTTVRQGIRYYYEVVASTKMGLSGPSEEVSAYSIGIPVPPCNAIATSELNAIRIEWDFPDDLNGIEVIGVNIYEGPSKDNMTFLHFSEGDSTCFVHGGLSEDRTYRYMLSTVTDWGDSELGPIVPQRPFLAPTPPTDLKASPSYGSIMIGWGTPKNTGNLPIKEYVIYRRPFKGVLEEISRTGASVSGYVDTGIERGKVYTYSVRARNDVSLSTPSDEVSASGQFCPDPPRNVSASQSGKDFSISWESPSYDGGSPIRSYTLYRTDDLGGFLSIGSILPNETGFLDQLVKKGIEYSYYVQSSNDIGVSGPSDTVMVRLPTPPSAPKGLNASMMGDKIALKWEAPSSDGGRPVLYYKIYRRAGNESLTFLSRTDNASRVFIDERVEEGTVYTYRLTAASLAGESPWSDQVSITSIGPMDENEDEDKGVGIVWVLVVIASIILAVLVVLTLVRRGTERDRGSVQWEMEEE